MSSITTGAGSAPDRLKLPSVGGYLLRLVGLAILDAIALTFVVVLVQDGVYPLAVAIAVVTIGLNAIFLVPGLYPIRWMSPALALLALLVVYPIVFTVYTAFTNYGDGHLLEKQQTIDLIVRQGSGTLRGYYLPEGALPYQWTAFRNEAGEMALWLTGDEKSYFALPGQPVEEVTPGQTGEGEFDDDGIPETYNGFTRLSRLEVVRYLSTLSSLDFGVEPLLFSVSQTQVGVAGQYVQRFVYDEVQDAIVDQETGTVYAADNEEGVFETSETNELIPGYRVTIGLQNFRRLFESPALRGPLASVFGWTILFAFLSVVSTFSLGLFIALILNDAVVPGRKIIRSLLIIPYAIPGVIGILILRGLLNPNLGVVTLAIERIFGVSIPWFENDFWGKVGILLINLWLGYPYMMLVCSGALQAIPSDIYEAAAVDGANGRQRFWQITLPMLLVGVGPLLIASFTFNFNNYVVIEAFNRGGPPIPDTMTPAGYTDILISYTYRLAFGTGRGADYGYASAITIIIFILVATVTLFQYRFTRRWEEVGENV